MMLTMRPLAWPNWLVSSILQATRAVLDGAVRGVDGGRPFDFGEGPFQTNCSQSPFIVEGRLLVKADVRHFS